MIENLLGCILISIGLFLIIIYLNLFVYGYTFLKFAYFIIRKGIILFIFIGLFFIRKGEKRL